CHTGPVDAHSIHASTNAMRRSFSSTNIEGDLVDPIFPYDRSRLCCSMEKAAFERISQSRRSMRQLKVGGHDFDNVAWIRSRPGAIKRFRWASTGASVEGVDQNRRPWQDFKDGFSGYSTFEFAPISKIVNLQADANSSILSSKWLAI
ncbi:hypothetical protein BVRB_016840, partial [Beta vulgaris subsp. vulgaris]